MSEFERMIDLREIGNVPIALSASAEECAALAARFDLVAVERLAATITLEPNGKTVNAAGRLIAEIVQSCAISGEDLPVSIDETLTLRFVPARAATAADIDLTAEELDELEYTGTAFDLGEAVAQSLALAIDPYLEGTNANTARHKVGLLGEDQAGPMASALRELLKKN
ncbi:DUF177 domain-containing protein [Novosphingobium sp.]|uniref:YceD family protein n=1 Tax=Novosphingobium sp. TaxID=1874826 RepID=UPI00286D289D|nr:DUF177 domain-containing protein [Novosphingobium sp.]